MLKRILFLLVLLAFVVTAAAQDCYNFTRTQAISYYNKSEYQIAIAQFKAANACPDKPAGNDLDAWINKCNAKIRAAEEAKRLAAEEAAMKQREQERLHAAKGYMNIHRIEFANTTKESAIIDAYGSVLTASNIKYLSPRIFCEGLVNSSKTIKVNIKIIKPDGTVMSGKTSPSGYTYSDEITIYSGSNNSIPLYGWGNESGGSYTRGTYRFELWYDGNKIYSQDFSLQGPTEATYLQVDSKTAVSSTYAASGGSETYYVSTDGPSYEVRLLPRWCSVTNKTESSFTIRWETNTGANARSDWFQVESGSKKVRVSVSQEAQGPSAEIERVWVDHNYFFGGVKGMLIHVKFSTHRMLRKSGNCNAYFHFENGTALKDYNRQYRATDGQVSVGDTFTPSYEDAVFNDFKLFLPYPELHLSMGFYNLKFNVQIFEGQQALATSEYISFTFSN